MAEAEKDSQGLSGAGGPGAPTGATEIPAVAGAPAAPTSPAGAGQPAPAKPAAGAEPALEQIPSGVPDMPPAMWDSEKNPYKGRLSSTQRALTERSERLKTLEAENAALKARTASAPAAPDSRGVPESTAAGDVQGYSDEEFLLTCTRTLDQWKQDVAAQAQQQSDMTGVTVTPAWPTVEAKRFAATMDGELARRGIPQPWSHYGMLVRRRPTAAPSEPTSAVQVEPQEPVDVERRISEVMTLREQVTDGVQAIVQTYPPGFLQQKVTDEQGRTTTLGSALKRFCIELKEPDADRVLAMYFTGFRDRAREQMVAAKFGQPRPGTVAGQQFTGVRTSPLPQHSPTQEVQQMYESVGMGRGGTAVAPSEDDADWEIAPSP